MSKGLLIILSGPSGVGKGTLRTELFKDEKCKLSDWLFDKLSGKEERNCSICEYEETREHNHSSAPNNLTYKLDKSNLDGTHRLKATYSCNICDEKITLYKEESSLYNEALKSQS